MYILKGLWLEYKVKAYEKAILGCTKARTKVKLKQTKMTIAYEAYVAKLKDHKS